MTNATLDALAKILESLLPMAEELLPSQVSGFLKVVEETLPVALQAGEALLTPLSALVGALLNADVELTDAQVAQLESQSDALDAALDAAAKADGLST